MSKQSTTGDGPLSPRGAGANLQVAGSLRETNVEAGIALARDRIGEAYLRQWGDQATVEKARQRIHWMISQIKGQRVLDVGTSEGIVPILLGREGFEVVGIDVNAEAIDYASQLLARESESVRDQVRLLNISIFKQSLEPSFDTLLIGNVIEHICNVERFIATASRYLIDGGRMIVTTPFGISPDPEQKTAFYLSDIKRLFEPVGRIDHLDIVDGDIRMVVTKMAADTDGTMTSGISLTKPSRLLTLTESVILRIQTDFLRRLDEPGARAEALRKRVEQGDDRTPRQLTELTQLTSERDESRLEAELGKASARIDQLTHELGERNKSVMDLESRLQSLLTRSAAAEQRVIALHAENTRKQANYRHIRHSLSYRLGNALITAFYRPGRQTIRLPVELYWILRDGFRLRSARRAAKRDAGGVRRVERDAPGSVHWAAPLREPSDRGYRADTGERVFKEQEQPLPARAAVAATSGRDAPTPLGGAPSGAHIVIQDPNAPILCLPFESPAPAVPRPLRVASILDTFTEACLAPECELVPIRPDNWRDLLQSQDIDMLFVESAWSGNAGAWLYRVAQYQAPPDNALGDLIAWCKGHDVPTTFWNKEDPPHFDRFIQRAGEFDFLFTTDANCIPRYQERCPNARVVKALPFAAQPSVHHPILTERRQSRVCFAGTYYADTHEERRGWMDVLLRASTEYGLDIFDRMYQAPTGQRERYLFPEDLRPYIRGSLEYAEMVQAYRRYQVFLNVNSVFDSPTMFSRRVFELLASGTPVVSTPSVGITNLFQSIVAQAQTSDEARRALDALLLDPEQWLRVSARGLRLVLSEHTYRHRLRSVCESLGIGGDALSEMPLVVIVRPTGDAGRFVALMKQQSLQAHEILVMGTPAREPAAQRHLEALSGLDQKALALPVDNIPSFLRNRYPHGVAVICESSRYYGPGYLLDALNAAKCGGGLLPSGMVPHLSVDNGQLQINISHRDQYGMSLQRIVSGTLALRADQVDARHLSGPDAEGMLEVPGGCFNRYGFDFALDVGLAQSRQLAEINLS